MRISDWSSDVCSSDLGADNGVLHEIFRNATADHEETGGARLDLDVRQFAEVSDRIHRQILTARLHGIDLMLHEAETRRGIGEGRAEDRHVMLIGELDEAVLLLETGRAPCRERGSQSV